MLYPPLPPSITVIDGTSVDDAFARFHVFEALHHDMQLCNPLASDDLQRVVDLLAPGDGETVLDIACGHGDLLLRCAERAGIRGVGVDLSPWVLIRASERAELMGHGDRLRWMLGDGADTPAEPTADHSTCLGASWIWDGFAGTVEALIARTHPGGRIAIGDVQRLPETPPEEVAEAFGVVLGRREQEAFLHSRGLDVIEEVRPAPESWDAYDDRIEASVTSFMEDTPGEVADQALSMHRDWNREHALARRQVTWTVWVAELPQ